MKNNRTIWIAMLLWGVMILFLFNYGPFKAKPVPSMNELLKQAQTAEQKAGDDKKALTKAAQQFAGVSKAYPRTEEGSEALLHAAFIYDTKLKNERMAVATYKDVIKRYPPDKYKAGAEAKTRLVAYETAMDKKHSKELGYKAIDWLVNITGRDSRWSYAIALLVITLAFKFVTTPLSHKQYQSMKEMQRLQPLIKQLQEKYKDNQQELGKKMMDLYKEHGVNPLSGCLPLLIQMPVLMLLYYKVILPYQYQFVKGAFLWIGSPLADRFPGIVAHDLSLPDIPLVIIYTISMIVSQKLSMVDPSQADQQKVMMYAMPVMFAFIFRSFPSAFMLYWLFFNIVSTAQQYYILRKPTGPDPHVPGGTATTGGRGSSETPQQPRRPGPVPGSRSRRRRRRFEGVLRPRVIWRPLPADSAT